MGHGTVYERTCTGCGNQFTAKDFRQLRCRKDCGRASHNLARGTRRLHNDIEFIGVDGEGVDRADGRHEYVMLSVGDRTLFDDGRELSLGKILPFLYECYSSKPDAAYIGFYLGYDFIQWQKQLPEDRARLLLTNAGILERKSKRLSRANPYPDAVVHDGWEIDIMAGRRFKLRPHVCHRSEWSDRCRNRTCNATIQIDDGPKIKDGENDFTPSDDGETFVGDAYDFWNRFTEPDHIVGQGTQKVKAYGWMYVCDTGPFWQTSFLNVINPDGWNGNPVCTDDEYKLVVAGKANRGNLADDSDTSYFDEMRMYNVLENSILARVTQRLNQGFMNDQIPIRIPKTDWYGPGRAAQLWMDQLHNRCADPVAQSYNKLVARNNSDLSKPRMERHNETGLLNADVYASMPAWFYDAAKASYYGGWFEQMVHGHCGDTWEYDINSAYPFIIATLPCLHTTNGHNGVYSRGNGADYPTGHRRYTLVYATVYGSNQYIGAMPYRNAQGLISRPQQTKGWYWLHEVEAGISAGVIHSFTVDEWVSYRKCDCPPPFNPDDIGIERMYQLRLEAGKNSPEGKALKLVYNSAYGKTAQSIGTPKYSNPVYASLITAGCRTLILGAIATHPKKSAAVTMVATDGIYFSTPHPKLELSSSQLGLWDETFKPGMTQLMPGVYWDDNTRKRIARMQSPKLKSRGVNAKDLAKQIKNLDHLFAVQHERLSRGLTYEWPDIEFSVSFLLDSAKLALQRGNWASAGKVTHDARRRLSSNPASKRDPVAYRDDNGGGITRTRPYTIHADVVSTPYDKAFGYVSEDLMVGLFGDRIGPDGDDGMQFWRDLING